MRAERVVVRGRSRPGVHRFAVASPNRLVISFPQHAGATVRVDGLSVKVTQGDVLFMPYGHPREVEVAVDDGAATILAYLHTSLVPSGLGTVLASHPGAMLWRDESLSALARLLFDSAPVPKVYRESLQTAFLSRLEFLASQLGPNPLSDLQIVSEVIRVVDSTVGRLDQSELAARFGLSPWQLSRKFKKVKGQTLLAYVQEARALSARRMIESEETPLGEVAAQLGYADQSHLGRAFRRQFGITPGVARKIAKEFQG